MRFAVPRELRRAVGRHRVLLAAGLAAAAVAAGLSTVTPAPTALTSVVAAGRDLPAGAMLSAGDLVAVALPEAAVPQGALRASPVGRLLAAPVRRGEPLTDVRLLGSGLLRSGSELVAVPVRVAEPAAAAMVSSGDRIDLLSADPRGAAQAVVVASDVAVLSVPTLGRESGDGALLVVAASHQVAARLAAAAVTGRLSLALLPRAAS